MKKNSNSFFDKIKNLKKFDYAQINSNFFYFIKHDFPRFLGKKNLKNSIFKSTLYLKEYKIWSKNKLFSFFQNTTNSKFLIIVLPFILHFSQIIFIKYKDQTFSVFLQKNLPGYSHSYESFFWQTFEYLDFENTNFRKKLNRIDIYNDFILIEANSISPTFQSQLFLANFPLTPTKNDLDEMSCSWNLKANCIFINPREFFVKSNSFFYKLDQFPLKLNTIYSSNENEFLDEKINAFDNNFRKNLLVKKLKENKISSPSSLFITNKKVSKFDKKNFFLKRIQFFDLYKIQNKKILKFITLQNQKLHTHLNDESINSSEKINQSKQSLSNSFQLKKDSNVLKNQHSFSNFSFFQNELNNFFYNKLLIPDTKLLSNDKLNNNSFDLESFFSNFCCENLIQLLNSVNLKKEDFMFKPRLMSGYFYPDLNKNNVKFYFLETFFKNNLLKGTNVSKNFNKKCKIKIFLPLSFYKYNFSNINPPKIELQYKPTFLEGVQYRQILYQGPGVLLDENTKDIYLTNKKQIQNWFKTFFYSDNPLSDRKQSFFGKNKYFSNEKLITNFNKTEKITEKNIYLKDKNLTFSLDKFKFLERPTIVPSIEDFRIPYLEEKQWRLILEKLKAESLKDTSKSNTLNEQIEILQQDEVNVSIPLIRIKYPKQKPVIWPLILLDYYSPHASSLRFKNFSFVNTSFNDIFIFDKTQNLKLFDHSSPNFITNKNYGGVYKKLFSFYPNLNPEKNFNSSEFNNFLSEDILYEETDKNGSSEDSNLSLNEIQKNLSSSFNSDKKNKKSYFFYGNISFLKNKLVQYFSHSFSQNWESLSISSFFIVAQFSFGLFILQILQNFYKKYGKELVSYLLDLVSSLGILDEGLKEELQLDENEKGFRIIYKNKKQFHHIAGIDGILPELSEIIWFLRNSARSFKMGNILPKGILLIGPAGTGKTLLVQAIAGEAEVPVLIQSGSSLNNPDQEGLGAQKLKNLFEKARELAPCIIFIDEIDTLGEKREKIIKNPMGSDEIIESIYEFDSDLKKDYGKFSQENFLFSKSKHFKPSDEGDLLNNFELENEENLILKSLQDTVSKHQLKQQQLTLLMQFLVELDGLQSRKGILVVGATNRPNVLDSALTRPGRFDKIFYLDLPGKEKRIEILKLYSSNLGLQKTISWEYLANLTFGFSAADLAAVMNESSIQAIIKDSIHTIETIEQGILFITSYSTEKSSLNENQINDPFYLTRLAYYQCGKVLLHTFLPNHPPAIVVYLWPRPKNARHKKFVDSFENSFSKIQYKSELEIRLIGFYAGKAAEFFSLIRNSSKFLRSSLPIKYRDDEKNQKLQILNTQDFSSKVKKLQFKKKFNKILSKKDLINSSFSLYWQSDLGFEDLNSATLLTYFIIDKWYFYSKNVIIRQYHQIIENKNSLEISEIDILEILNQLTLENEKHIFQEKKSLNYEQIYQNWSIKSWWQLEMINQASFSDVFFSDWYRIYLPNPEENERNEEWSPPDTYYHDNESLMNLLSQSKNYSLIWNNFYSIDRDYISHGLILLAFNKAFTILDQNRELLDYFADYLLRYEIIRQPDILNLLNNFNKPIQNTEFQNLNQLKLFSIFEKKWGKNSRKKKSRFINFEKLESKNQKFSKFDMKN